MSGEPERPFVPTGLRCQQCKRTVVQIVDETPKGDFVFRCPACGHQWSTDQPPKPKA
jgi:DNA-directed RNA polymerase subunit RPC12/RpoP